MFYELQYLDKVKHEYIYLCSGNDLSKLDLVIYALVKFNGDRIRIIENGEVLIFINNMESYNFFKETYIEENKKKVLK